jgi:hypothetical protein
MNAKWKMLKMSCRLSVMLLYEGEVLDSDKLQVMSIKKKRTNYLLCTDQKRKTMTCPKNQTSNTSMRIITMMLAIALLHDNQHAF